MSRDQPILVVLVAVTLLVGVIALIDPDTPARSQTTITITTTTASTVPDVTQKMVGYVVSRPGARYAPTPGEPSTVISGGVVFAVLGEVAGGFRVFDVCNREGWLPADDVEVGRVPVERNGFARAVFVIDPGHGFPDLGAVGPTRLLETEVNLDVSERIATLLRSSRNVDWSTGAVTAGSQIPAVADVVLTRSSAGPNGGDYEASLTFRATLGNAVRADAIVSIHHNSGGSDPLDHPGAESYVSAFDPESARLGGLIVDELRRSFSRFDISWTGAAGNGVFARVGVDGHDYYTLIDVAEVPAVIVEAAYISNPEEEALAKTDEFRQAYAEAVYRALVRFITTADDPIPSPQVETFDPGGPSRSFESCQVPAGD